MAKERIYVLKGKKRPLTWQLRNKGVMVPREVDGKIVGLREIQYVPGASSIWKEDNEKEGKPASLVFTDGTLRVSENDKVQIEFIENHTGFNVRYELFDPEAKAEEEYKQFELAEKATSYLRDNQDDEDRMAAVAASLFGPQTMSWGAKQTKMRCFSYAKEKPQEVIDALNDPAADAKYIAALGLRKGVVATNPQKTAVVWADKDRGVICPIPAGQKALAVLGDFLFIEDNVSTLQEIGNRIAALDEKKKPTPKKGKDKK